MTEVVGVRFKTAGKIYYFDPNNEKINPGAHVIVETIRGVEYGTVVHGNRNVSKEHLVSPLRTVIRVATPSDDETYATNKLKEKEAFEICLKKIIEKDMDMKLIDTEMTFDRNKIIFYFTSDGRVDFRELVKDLAAIFKTRIELRQIGVRDEAKMLNCIGICGRSICCSTFLGDFHPVSIKMAKEQNLSLNPTKISGVCGRLMCCLKYEEESYEELNKNMPNVGDIIESEEGTGEILSTNVLMQQVKAAVKKTPNDAPTIKVYPISEIKVIKRRKNKKSNKDELNKNDDKY